MKKRDRPNLRGPRPDLPALNELRSPSAAQTSGHRRYGAWAERLRRFRAMPEDGTPSPPEPRSFDGACAEGDRADGPAAPAAPAAARRPSPDGSRPT